MQRRCDRNRKRSKRRAIYCPIHRCCIDSVSPKWSLFADHAQQLQQRGVGRKSAMMLIATQGTIALEGEWLEAFWCQHCQATNWYHVRKIGVRTYDVESVPQELWQQVNGVMHPNGNPSVSEFTLKQARGVGDRGVKEFRAIG